MKMKQFIIFYIISLISGNNNLPYPFFWRNELNLLNYVSSSKTIQIMFQSEHLDYTLSLAEDYYICSILPGVKYSQIEILIHEFPSIDFEESFRCLIIELKPQFTSVDQPNFNNRFQILGELIDLIQTIYSNSYYNNFVTISKSINNILRLTWKLELNSVVVNEIINIIIQYSKDSLKEADLIRQANGNYLNTFITNSSEMPFKISDNIFIKFKPNEQILFLGFFNLSNFSFRKNIKFNGNSVVLINRKNHSVTIKYRVSFKFRYSNKKYACIKRNLSENIWSADDCILSSVTIYRDNIYNCECENDGILSLTDKFELFSQRSKISVYLDTLPLDMNDDYEKYIKEDAIRYMPIIMIVTVIILIVSVIIFFAYCITGIIFNFRSRRFFRPKETITIILFLISLCVSHFFFHLIIFLILTKRVSYSRNICTAKNLFQINYNITPIIFQTFLFFVSITETRHIILTTSLPIFIAAGPISSAFIALYSNEYVDHCFQEILNMHNMNIYKFIFLPGLILSGLTIVYSGLTWLMTRQVKNSYGYVVPFGFSLINCGGGLCLLMIGNGILIDLSYYIYFCFLSIVIVLYLTMLLMMLVILNNTNISLIEQHCTIDIDTALIRRFFRWRKPVKRMKTLTESPKTLS